MAGMASQLAQPTAIAACLIQLRLTLCIKRQRLLRTGELALAAVAIAPETMAVQLRTPGGIGG